MIQFINTTHPDDTTSKKSLSKIRSHVAKRARALEKERKQRHPQSYILIPNAPVGEHGIYFRSKTQKPIEEKDLDHNAKELQYSSREQPGQRGLRILAPKQETLHNQPRESVDINHWETSPVQLIGSSRNDAYQGFAKVLSIDELNLFDFYLNYVISYCYTGCYHGEPERTFQSSMREVWVPFAMTQPGLMAAIFHVACRNYAVNIKNDYTERFVVKKLQYRLTCLNMAREAVSSQAVANDVTIALVLLMASESYMEGDIDAFVIHGNGIIDMVNSRGGLESLGLSGFLSKNIGNCIYNPRNTLVQGPNDLE